MSAKQNKIKNALGADCVIPIEMLKPVKHGFKRFWYLVVGKDVAENSYMIFDADPGSELILCLTNLAKHVKKLTRKEILKYPLIINTNHVHVDFVGIKYI